MSTLLVLDDDVGIRENLAEYLEDEGYECKTTELGSEGLELCRQCTAIRLVIVDLRLPDMGGVEFIEKVHRLNGGIGCLIHTGSVEFELPESLLLKGVSEEDLFYKPIIDMPAFINRIEWHLKDI